MFADDAAANRDGMIVGIAMHDLEIFPQSCREPDLSEFAPRAVAECSDHWSLSNGAGMLAWAGLAVPMRLFGTRAALAYLSAANGDGDHAHFYASMGFMSVGPVVGHPFVETIDGCCAPVQAVLLSGHAFDHAMEALSQACVGYSDDARVFYLEPDMRALIRATRTRSQVAQPNDGRSHAAEMPEYSAAAG